MDNNDQQAAKASLESLKKDALQHYEDVSTKAHHWNSFIPKAIESYQEWVNADEEKPPLKEGWSHSEQVALYYPPTVDRGSGLGIGFWHQDPPFAGPMFVDFANYGRIPSHWCTLPPPPQHLNK